MIYYITGTIRATTVMQSRSIEPSDIASGGSSSSNVDDIIITRNNVKCLMCTLLQ